MKKVHVCGAVIRDDQNQILCALRSPSMSLPNMWEFPGGKIELGEDPKDALVREIKEELGCTIEVFERIAEVEHIYPNLIVHLLTYESKIISGTPTAKEHAKIEWIPLNNLRSLNWAPADLPTVDKLLSHPINI